VLRDTVGGTALAFPGPEEWSNGRSLSVPYQVLEKYFDAKPDGNTIRLLG
jgi:hypothetical protein